MPSLRARKIRARYERRAPPMPDRDANYYHLQSRYYMAQMEGLPYSERVLVWETNSTSEEWDKHYKWDVCSARWHPLGGAEPPSGYYPSAGYPRETLQSSGAPPEYTLAPPVACPLPDGLRRYIEEIEREVHKANQVAPGRPGGQGDSVGAGPRRGGDGTSEPE